MKYVIRLTQLARGEPSPHAGEWIKHFEPGAPGSRGELVTTNDVDRAKRFPSQAEAFKFWRQDNGVRSDGEPNRPLTAWTVDISPIDDGDRA